MDSPNRSTCRRFPKPGDFILLGLILAASFMPVRYLPAPGAAGTLDLFVDNIRIRTIAAGADAVRLDTLPVRNGRMVFEYGQGRARVVSANCPNKICMHAGAIGRNGQSLICVPNRVTALLRSSGEPLDGLAR